MFEYCHMSSTSLPIMRLLSSLLLSSSILWLEWSGPCAAFAPSQLRRPVSLSCPRSTTRRWTTTPSFEEKDEEDTPASISWTRQQFQLSIPALLSLLADPLLSVVDTAFVGRLGTTALASLGSVTSIFHLAFNTFRATTFATTSLVGPYHAAAAAKDNKNGTTVVEDTDLQAVTRLSLQWGLLLGVGIGVFLLGCGDFILATMGIPASTSPLYPHAASYLGTRAWAAPAVAFTAVATGLFRGAGTTVMPLIASLIASGFNLVLDPILMFGKVAWGVKGAAAATAISQFAAAVVLGTALLRTRLVTLRKAVPLPEEKRRLVWTTIWKANASMMAKQGSLLGAWAFCTAQATRLGQAHVAAHQVALSVWLVVALMLDSNAVGAQILASRYFQPDKHRQSSTFFSLLRYQAKLALAQGVGATILITTVLAPLVPVTMGTDQVVRYHLQQLLPTLALQQILVSCTLVTEALAAATQQFTFLAVGTVAATALSVWQLQTPTTVTGLWNRGIVTLFVGRWITASLALRRALKGRADTIDGPTNGD